MRSANRLAALAGVVLAPSAVLYALHLALFRDPRNVGFYTLMDLAFLPVQAVLVSVVLEAFLARREFAERTRKLGMVSGAFFSEVGDGLLRLLAAGDPRLPERRAALRAGAAWKAGEFEEARRASAALGASLSIDGPPLGGLDAWLEPRRGFLLRLLENPLLLDHESLTDALMAVFHLHDELRLRRGLAGRAAAGGEADRAHLATDLERAYGTLLAARLVHLEALKASYPFLYSLALRTDPLDPSGDPRLAGD